MFIKSIVPVFILFLSLCSGGLFAEASGSRQASETRPNIIFFLIDDQRNDSLGCAGHPIVKTPVIDQLAAQGTRFTNAFVTTSICAASRATIFTGLYERTHNYTFGKPRLSEFHMTKSYPRMLRDAGYRTGFIGKFGVKTQAGEAKRMFDMYKPLSVSGKVPFFKKQKDGSLRHLTEISGDHAIEFLRNNPKDKNFCLSVSFNASHAVDGDKKNHFPWPKAVDGLYDDVEIPLPRLGDPAIFEAHPDFLKDSFNRERYFWRWDTAEKYQKNMKGYYRMLSGIDRVIGRVQSELKELGLDENTIIVYMGDNGYYMGDRGFAGKWSHYEQSLRVPLIVYDPTVDESLKGRINDKMVLNVDIPPTLLAYGDVDAPKHYQGLSLKPLVAVKGAKALREDFFCEHLMENGKIPKWEGIRGERYVYARYVEEDPAYEYLHDLKTDPDQLKNFVNDPEYKKILRSMRKRCDALKGKYEKAR